MLQQPEVRKLKDGDVVVDLGPKWFRVHPDGRVTTRQSTFRKGDLYGSLRKRKATEAEAKFAREHAAPFMSAD